MLTRTLAETRTDRHGNVCVIMKVSDRPGCLAAEQYTVQYEGSARRWLQRNGSPYWNTLKGAQAAVDRN